MTATGTLPVLPYPPAERLDLTEQLHDHSAIFRTGALLVDQLRLLAQHTGLRLEEVRCR